ncbi:MAG: hypothetical protein KY457_07765 [Actinobacteria bacterium]|nr:hypothetical protein [Actinomycetota bacterium]
MPSTTASVLAALALTGALVGAGAATFDTPSATSPTPATEQVSVRTEPTDRISIECGGYDADGNVVHEAATRIDHARVDAAGIPEIPAVCGGYTAEGEFIGDD